MKAYRIQHNLDCYLGNGQPEVRRCFKSIEYANEVFESYLPDINYDNDEWLVLEEVSIEVDSFGELFVKEGKLLRFFSDSTKIGVKFNPKEVNSDEKD